MVHNAVLVARFFIILTSMVKTFLFINPSPQLRAAQTKSLFLYTLQLTMIINETILLAVLSKIKLLQSDGARKCSAHQNELR